MANSCLIVGPGAIGLLLASRIQKSGVRVTLLDHSEARAKEQKTTCVRDQGAEEQLSIPRTADPGIARAHKHIMVCVKAHTTQAVVTALSPFVTKDCSILSLQNGMGNQDILATLPCHDKVRLATITYGARRLNPNTVLMTGHGKILIGSSPDDPVGANWHALLAEAGFHTAYCPETKEMLWKKLVLNAALNPVTAMYRIKNGELLSHSEAWQTSMDILSESVKIANAAGMAIRFTDMQAHLRQICRETSENQTSMLEDLLAGKRTEVAHINGAIVETARALKLPATCNQQIQKDIEEREQQSS